MRCKCHLQFLQYVLLHKWLVFQEAYKLGIVWRGIVHDLSKFTPAEWEPRVKALGKGAQSYQDDLGWYIVEKVPEDLAKSWLCHYHANPHHWQWWVIMLDGKVSKVLPMTDEYRREMLADWRAVARMPGRQSVIPWYLGNRDKMLFHPDTQHWIEAELGLE